MSPAPLLPIPYAHPLKVPAVQDQPTREFLDAFVTQYEKDRMIQAQNTLRLDRRTAPPPPPDTSPILGDGLARSTLDGSLMGLTASTLKNGLLLANGTDRGKVNVTFNYLGIGPVVVGSGAAVTYTADLAVAGANGLDTGAEAANTWYYVFIIVGPGREVMDATGNNLQPFIVRRSARVASLLSTAAAPTLPAGFTRYRRVGMVRNNGTSDLYRFLYVDSWITWNEDISAGDFLVLNAGTATTFTAVSCASVVPTTSTVAELSGVANISAAADQSLRIRPTGSNYVDNDSCAAVRANLITNIAGRFRTSLNSTQQLDYRVLAGSVSQSASLSVLGYYDPV